MTRHIIDIPKTRRTPQILLRFLRIARREVRPDLHPILARLPRSRANERGLAQFCRIDRQGPDRI